MGLSEPGRGKLYAEKVEQFFEHRGGLDRWGIHRPRALCVLGVQDLPRPVRHALRPVVRQHLDLRRRDRRGAGGRAARQVGDPPEGEWEIAPLSLEAVPLRYSS